MYTAIIRPLLFLLKPETVHNLVVSLLKIILVIPGLKSSFKKVYSLMHPSLEREVFGLKFNNPVGLAAGFDKNADFFSEFSHFGFSFIEIGTVTPLAQPGNPKPRSFRLKKDFALINRMGFNNKGVHVAAQNLIRERRNITNLIVGGNIGKNTATANTDAAGDYLYCFDAIYDYVDYIAINISCPNIQDLRNLQEGDELSIILETIMNSRVSKSIKKPVLLKVSPDLSNQQIKEIVEIAERFQIDGYIATNTTTSRNGLVTDEKVVSEIGNGGLSGKPLKLRSTEVIKEIHQLVKGKKPIIGVGGILDEFDAIEKLDAGASLIQIYTGFIYSGPGLVKRINKYILKNKGQNVNS